MRRRTFIIKFSRARKFTVNENQITKGGTQFKKNNFPFVSEIILYTNKSIFSDFDFRKSTYDNSVITFDRKRIKSTKT